MNQSPLSLKISNLEKLSSELMLLSQDNDFLSEVYARNNWFLPGFVQRALTNICEEYLHPQKLATWIEKYPTDIAPQAIGLILAGNIPLVGFQDLLCAYMSPHTIKLKISSKDEFLTKIVLNKWFEIDADFKNRVIFSELIKDIDKIIATGSNNSHQYFEYYFSKYKHILRKNRTSVAIVPKDITDEELDGLVDDIFLFFGLGCRNISKLYIEKGFNTNRLFEKSERYNFLFNQQRYMNNYDYQRTLLLLNKEIHLSNNFLILKEDKSLHSPISNIFYQYFENIDEVYAEIDTLKDEIQCVVSRNDNPFGKTQMPSLTDYADNIDVMEFLLNH